MVSLTLVLALLPLLARVATVPKLCFVCCEGPYGVYQGAGFNDLDIFTSSEAFTAQTRLNKISACVERSDSTERLVGLQLHVRDFTSGEDILIEPVGDVNGEQCTDIEIEAPAEEITMAQIWYDTAGVSSFQIETNFGQSEYFGNKRSRVGKQSKQVVLKPNNVLIGLFGYEQENEIASLGFIEFKTDCPLIPKEKQVYEEKVTPVEKKSDAQIVKDVALISAGVLALIIVVAAVIVVVSITLSGVHLKRKHDHIKDRKVHVLQEPDPTSDAKQPRSKAQTDQEVEQIPNAVPVSIQDDKFNQEVSAYIDVSDDAHRVIVSDNPDSLEVDPTDRMQIQISSERPLTVGDSQTLAESKQTFNLGSIDTQQMEQLDEGTKPKVKKKLLIEGGNLVAGLKGEQPSGLLNVQFTEFKAYDD